MPAVSEATLSDLGRFLEHGLSIIVSTRDAAMIPEICRSGGARLGEDGLLRALVPLPEGERTLANIADNGVIALTGAIPSTYETLQVKGHDARQVTWAEGDEIAPIHRDRFREQVARFGMTELAQSLWSFRFVAIAFTPTSVFEQSPGPVAGMPFRR